MPTKITWATDTWNPIVGCSKISAGCANCYAERMAERQAYMGNKNYLSVINHKAEDLSGENVVNEPQIWYEDWSGTTVFVESALTKPLHWKTPRKIFVNSMGDTFHPSVPFEWIGRIFAVAALCPQHQFMFLTKRAGRMREFREWLGDWNAKPIVHPKDIYGGDRGKYGEKLVNAMLRAIDKFNLRRGAYSTLGGIERLLSNVHLGVTVENQESVSRIADLNWTRAVKKFLSIEPLLPGKLNMRAKMYRDQDGRKNKQWMVRCIDYVFIGCESGSGARLCTLDDIRYVMHQCREAGVKIHVKQIPLNGKCNKNFDEWPPEFQVREV